MNRSRRDGRIVKTLFFLLVLLGVLAGGGYAAWKRLAVAVKVEPPQLVAVKKEMFVHEILERGSVDSASNIEIRCQVESAGGLTIISVVPEGTVVKKGDLLVELDSSTLRENVTKQRIAVAGSEAKLAQSKADLRTAELTLTEYLDGKFNEEKKSIANDIASAKEKVRTESDNVSFNKKLLERGYITESQVKAGEYALEQAINEQQIAELKMYVLENFTSKKMVVQYEASIETANAKVKSDEESLNLDKDRLAHLERQLELCQVIAPQDGQVIYYMPRYGGDEDLIKEGKKVVERQIMLRLPDPSQMQVRGLINEANIRLVKIGQLATVRLEAFPNQVFSGVVKQVNDYPEPGSWMGGSMSKEYMTTITILDAPEGIKPGLTAEAKVVVNEIPDALQLPVQAVFEYGGKTYCVTYNNGVWDKLGVKTGPSNDKHVVILEGLTEGDMVVLGAWAHRDRIDLPKLKPEDENAKQDELDQLENAERPERPDGTIGGPPSRGDGPPRSEGGQESRQRGPGRRGDRSPDGAPRERPQESPTAETPKDEAKETPKEPPKEEPKEEPKEGRSSERPAETPTPRGQRPQS